MRWANNKIQTNHQGVKWIMDNKEDKKINNNGSLLSEMDLFLFNEGSHTRIYEKMGSHPVTLNGVLGTYFGVWAPNAQEVAVTGDFNNWNKPGRRLNSRGQSGIWEGFITGICQGDRYKYHIVSKY
jgi:1,4-alpha-glucan branching enzyme